MRLSQWTNYKLRIKVGSHGLHGTGKGGGVEVKQKHAATDTDGAHPL